MRLVAAIALALLALPAMAGKVMVLSGSGAPSTLGGWAIDANGWLDDSALTVEQTIYVSTSGDDGNDGLSTGAPVATIAAGYALLRDGHADHMLLKRGDSWPSDTIQILISGVSKTAPLVIGAYGTGDRPIVLRIKGGTDDSHGYVVFRDIHTVAAATPGVTPVFVENCWFGGTDTLVEDPIDATCYFGRSSTVSRCIFDDHYYSGGASKTGLYFAKDGFTLYGSYFYGNVDREMRVDELTWGNSHATYIQVTATNVVIDNSIVFLMDNGGIGPRSGGTVTDCLGYRAQGGCGNVGYDYSWPANNPYGVTGYSARNICLQDTGLFFRNSAVSGMLVEDNIVVNGNMLNSAKSRGGVLHRNIVYQGRSVFSPYAGTVELGDLVTPSFAITDHVAVRSPTTTTSEALEFTGQAEWMAFTDTIISNGTNPTSNFIQINGDQGITVEEFQTYFGDAGAVEGTPNFVDPTRGLKSYLESLGMGPYADEAAAWNAFVSIMRAQDRTTWDTRFEAEAINAHIRAGFEVAP